MPSGGNGPHVCWVVSYPSLDLQSYIPPKCVFFGVHFCPLRRSLDVSFPKKSRIPSYPLTFGKPIMCLMCISSMMFDQKSSISPAKWTKNKKKQIQRWMFVQLVIITCINVCPTSDHSMFTVSILPAPASSFLCYICQRFARNSRFCHRLWEKGKELQALLQNSKTPFPLSFTSPATSWNEKKHTNPHRIHGTGIFTYIWAVFIINVGKYTIHGRYGTLDIWYTSHEPRKKKKRPCFPLNPGWLNRDPYNVLL